MSEVSAFVIDDGYTERGYLAAVDRVHPACRFEYRPALPEERMAQYRETPKDAKSEALLKAHFIKAHLARWDLTYRPKKDGPELPAPLEVDFIRKLKPNLMARLYNVIAGVEIPDEDPEASAAEKADQQTDKTEAATSGAPFRSDS